jgi:hypothetical protein
MEAFYSLEGKVCTFTPRGVAPAAIEHDRGAALPNAVQVQTVLTHVDHLSGSGEGLAMVDLGNYGLVDRPINEGQEECD